MSVEVKVPELPESVSEATVAAWHKKPGDKVGRDENVVDLETDKVMLEVPATAEGVLKEILKKEGETVNSGDVIAIMGEGGEDADSKAPEEKGEKRSLAVEQEENSERETSEEQGEEDANRESDESGDEAAAPLSPAVRKLVAEHDLDPSRVKGSGKDGRLLKSDVQDYLEQAEKNKKSGTREKTSVRPGGEKQSGEKTREPESRSDEALPTAGTGGRSEERVPMTRIRARIAERLVEAQQTAAILTTFNEVDLFEISKLRERYKTRFEKENDIRLGFMSFFVKATVESLKRFPIINASVDGKDIIYHGYYDIGIAVSSPRGLVVPILRDVDRLGFAEVEQKIREYGLKARDNKLTMDDLQGGTFSITNGGVFGSMLSTPILNPPQSAILGMHNIQDRAMVVDGEVKVRPVMYLALSYDHRIVDGREAVLFLSTIKGLLEDPSRILLQI